ncbi:MAG TPA: ATP-binding protein, partial [Polyangiaceae bacterium]|nr:ATP-binding protein [Polyangiaceae bacterium]
FVPPSSPVPRIPVDPGKIRQVVLNLAENAVKFTPADGRVTLSVSVASDADPDEDGFGFALLAAAASVVEIRVADTGIGISADQREKVFDAFYQIDSSSTREYGGTGLGLAIVKRLVDAHGGSVRIEDNTPHGTVFVVSLPISLSPAP